MRGRDIGVVLVALAALLVSLHSQPNQFSLIPSFETSPNAYERSLYMFDEEESIDRQAGGEMIREHILVTDLEGDGIQDVIVGTLSGQVNVLHRVFPSVEETPFREIPIRISASTMTFEDKKSGNIVSFVRNDSQSDTEVQIKSPDHDSSAASSLNTNHFQDGRISCLASGYLDPIPTGGKSTGLRKQIILILRRDLMLLAFSHELKLKWQVSLKDFLRIAHHHYVVVRDASLLITPSRIRTADHGTVIVGIRVERDKNVPDSNSPEHSEEADADSFHHFSYFALDGGSGSLRWRHDTHDFVPEESREETTPQQNYKMDLSAFNTAKHTGEVHWRTYREAILATLPHRWSSELDTRLKLAHFHRRSSSRDVKTSQAKDDLIEYIDSNLGEALNRAFHAPHSSSDLVIKPNVILAHLKQGIEVIHFFSGRTLTQVPLSPHAAYADVNGDFKIERISVGDATDSTGGTTSRTSRCLIRVDAVGTRGSSVFLHNLCSDMNKDLNGFTSTLSHRSSPDSLNSESDAEKSIDALVPLVMPHVNSNLRLAEARAALSRDRQQKSPISSMIPEYMWSSRLSSFHRTTGSGLSSSHFVRNGQDLVFALSTGDVYCFDGRDGFLRWHVSTGEGYAADAPPRFASIELLSSVPGGEPDLIVILWGRSLSLHRALDGSVEDIIRLDSDIAGHLIPGDFNSDGLTDFLVPGRAGRTHYAFALRRENSIPFLASVIGVLVACIIALVAAHRFHLATRPELPFVSHSRVAD